MSFLIIILNLRHYDYVTNSIDDALVPSFGTGETFTVDTSKSNFSKKKKSLENSRLSLSLVSAWELPRVLATIFTRNFSAKMAKKETTAPRR